MGKRKATENGHAASDDSGSDDDISMLDVDFEFFSPAEQDFHGLKALLRQLFDSDADQLDLSGLADLILSEPSTGSTVKCDGEDSDPFAFLTFLPLQRHATHPAVQSLVSYLVARAATSPVLAPLVPLLGSGNVALVLGERLINMPHQVVPALYTMLRDDLAENTSPAYTHFLVLSKTYVEVVSALPNPGERASKKSKQGPAADGAETFYFHAEDEALAGVAEVVGGWDYEKVDEGASDARRAFQDVGIRPRGHAVLIEGNRWGEAVEAVVKYLGGNPAA